MRQFQSYLQLQVYQKIRGRIELLKPILSATLDKCKISDRDAVNLSTACVEALSLDPSVYVINQTSIKNSRENYR